MNPVRKRKKRTQTKTKRNSNNKLFRAPRKPIELKSKKHTRKENS